jgi:hypothetical protein
MPRLGAGGGAETLMPVGIETRIERSVPTVQERESEGVHRLHHGR